jgi:hypothetical protein
MLASITFRDAPSINGTGGLIKSNMLDLELPAQSISDSSSANEHIAGVAPVGMCLNWARNSS